MTTGTILHASHAGVEVLRFIGEIRYMLAPALDRYLESLFAEPGLAGFVIDLSETEMIDSTNLGVLAGIAKRMEVRGGPRVTLVSNRADINEVLVSMGLDEVFEIVASSVTGADQDHELLPENVDRASAARTLLKAHRTLMSLNEANQALFEEVVSTLEREPGGKP